MKCVLTKRAFQDILAVLRNEGDDALTNAFRKFKTRDGMREVDLTREGWVKVLNAIERALTYDQAELNDVRKTMAVYGETSYLYIECLGDAEALSRTILRLERARDEIKVR